MIVTPYGDPNAHGTIGKTLTFIRRRGAVYCRPYNVPYDPRTQDQLDQRQLFRDAKEAWHALSSESRDYYNLMAQGQSYTGYNLFMSHYMLGTLPSETPLSLGDITNSVIGDLRASVFNGWKHQFDPDPPGSAYGYIWDNQNIYQDGTSYATPRNLVFNVSKIAENIGVQLKDRVTIIYDAGQMLTIFLPEITTNTTLYVAEDGSTYYDAGLTKLACSPYI